METYRWYLCTQTKPDKWACGERSYEEVTNPFFFSNPNLPTKAVPILNFFPRILDPFFLHKSLHPKIVKTA